jgi:hypothetical protein
MASLLPPKNRPLDWRYSVMRISDRIFGAVVILWSFMYVMAARGIAKPFFLQTRFGHWAAVKCGHRRGFFTRDVQQDGRNPPAIHRAEINRGKQHHRGRHIKTDREGQRDLVLQHRCLSPTSCCWR